MDNNTQLPVEVVKEIHASADAYMRSSPEEGTEWGAYVNGANTYASKLHQLDEHFKVMQISCDAQLEKIQQLQQENDKLKQQATDNKEYEEAILRSQIKCGQVLYDVLRHCKTFIHNKEVLNSINNALQQWDGGKY